MRDRLDLIIEIEKGDESELDQSPLLEKKKLEKAD